MRMIDADALRNKLSTICPLYATDEYDYCAKDILEKVDDLIQKQPTAYDVDKVIEQLEEYAHSNICNSHSGCPYGNNEDINCENCGALGAVEIVKSGGIE